MYLDKENEDLKVELINSIIKHKLVVFVGAGISRLMGLPSWKEVAIGMLESAYNNRLVNFNQKELIKYRISNPKMLITIVYNLYEERSQKCSNPKKWIEKYYSELKNLLSETLTNEKKYRILSALKAINAPIITTNADELLDFTHYKIYEKVESSMNEISSFINTPSIVHIHGSVRDNKTLVFRIQDYLSTYTNTTETQDFIRNLFHSPVTLLFLGYGLSELELLQYLLDSDNVVEANRYIFEGYSSSENIIKTSMKKYYEIYKIKQITYCKDEIGYDAIMDLLDEISKKIQKETPLTINSVHEIMNIIKNDSDVDYNRITRRIKEIDSSYYPQVFQEINGLNKPFIWYKKFYELEKKHFYSPEILLQKDGAGVYYTWDILFYFNQISNCLLKSEIEEYNTISAQLLYEIDCFIIKSPASVNDSNFILNYFDLIMNYNQDNQINYLSNLFDLLIKSKNYIFSLILHRLNELQIKKIEIVYLVFDKALEYFYVTKSTYVDVLIEMMNKYINNLLIEQYDKLIDKVCSYIDMIIGNNKFEYYDMGAIDDYNDNKNTMKFKDLLILYITRIVSFVSKEKIDQILKRPKSHFHLKLKIYCISSRFSEYQSVFFGLTNPFDDWDSYASLFFLIQKNHMLFDDEQFSKLNLWVNETNFGRKNKEYIGAIKFQLFSMLGEYNLESKEKLLDYKKYSNQAIPAFNDLNKHFRLLDPVDNSKQEYLKIEDYDEKQIVQYIKMSNGSFFEDDMHRAIIQYFTKNINTLLTEKKVVLSMNLNLICDSVELIKKHKETVEDSSYISFLYSLVDVVINNGYDVFWYIIDLIESKELYIKNQKHIESILTRLLNYYASKTYNEHTLNDKIINHIINNPIYHLTKEYIHLIVKTSVKEIPSIIINLLEENNSCFVKAALVSSIKEINEINEEWTKANIGMLMDNCVGETNYSAYSLPMSNVDFFKYNLNQLDFFKLFLQHLRQTEDSITKHYYYFWIIQNYNFVDDSYIFDVCEDFKSTQMVLLIEKMCAEQKIDATLINKALDSYLKQHNEILDDKLLSSLIKLWCLFEMDELLDFIKSIVNKTRYINLTSLQKLLPEFLRNDNLKVIEIIKVILLKKYSNAEKLYEFAKDIHEIIGKRKNYTRLCECLIELSKRDVRFYEFIESLQKN